MRANRDYCLSKAINRKSTYLKFYMQERSVYFFRSFFLCILLEELVGLYLENINRYKIQFQRGATYTVNWKEGCEKSRTVEAIYGSYSFLNRIDKAHLFNVGLSPRTVNMLNEIIKDNNKENTSEKKTLIEIISWIFELLIDHVGDTIPLERSINRSLDCYLDRINIKSIERYFNAKWLRDKFGSQRILLIKGWKCYIDAIEKEYNAVREKHKKSKKFNREELQTSLNIFNERLENLKNYTKIYEYDVAGFLYGVLLFCESKQKNLCKNLTMQYFYSNSIEDFAKQVNSSFKAKIEKL